MNRRHVIRAAGAVPLIGFPAIFTARRARAATLLDPSRPEDLHIIHRKLSASMDERPVFWFIDAIRLGLKDYEFTPFWRMHVGFVFVAKTLDEFLYETSLIMTIFYSDLKTGKLLETWDNPYTGQTRTVQQPGVTRLTRTHGLTGEIHKSAAEQPLQNRHRRDNIGPAAVVNDDVWCNGDLVQKIGKPNRLGQDIYVNDWSTFHGSISEVSDPKVTSAAATHTFNDINSFNHSWIGMRGVTANSVSRGHGRKSHSLEGMPGPWRAFMNRRYPEIVADLPGELERI